MQNIIHNLYVGDETDFGRADAKKFAIVSACKDGPHSHRGMLGYETAGAPQNKDYFFARNGRHIALNLIDAHDPRYIPNQVMDAAIQFINENIEDRPVLIHCNKGESRSGAVAMLYMRSVGELPERYREAYKIFKTLYPKFNPGLGMEQYLKQKFGEMKNG